jgi:hypothetical protein
MQMASKRLKRYFEIQPKHGENTIVSNIVSPALVFTTMPNDDSI